MTFTAWLLSSFLALVGPQAYNVPFSPQAAGGAAFDPCDFVDKWWHPADPACSGGGNGAYECTDGTCNTDMEELEYIYEEFDSGTTWRLERWATGGRPQWTTVNGVDCVDFNHNQADALKLVNVPGSYYLAQPITYIFYIDLDDKSGTPSHRIMGSKDQASYEQLIRFDEGPADIEQDAGTQQDYLGESVMTAHIFAFHFDGANSTVEKDCENLGTPGDTGAEDMDSLAFGRHSGGGDLANGRMCGFAVKLGAWTTVEDDARLMQSYLCDQYGLTSTCGSCTAWDA